MTELKTLLQSLTPISDKEFDDSKRNFYDIQFKKRRVITSKRKNL
jgi:hypothetical protein